VDPDLPEFRRRCIPQVADYLKEVVRTTGIRVTAMSAVRSVPDQNGIKGGGNLNAAPIDGPMVSAHLFGAAVDLKYINLSLEDRIKIGEKLLADKRANRIAVALEKGQEKCFHIVVFRPKTITPPPTQKAAPKTTKKKKTPTKKKKRVRLASSFPPPTFYPAMLVFFIDFFISTNASCLFFKSRISTVFSFCLATSI